MIFRELNKHTSLVKGYIFNINENANDPEFVSQCLCIYFSIGVIMFGMNN